MGQALFLRSNKGLAPTEAGHCALGYARTVQSQVQNLAADLNGLASGESGRLRLGSIMGAVPFVSEILLRFIKKHPAVSVEFEEDTSWALLRRLDAGEIDVVIARTTVSNRPEQYRSIICRDETLAVVANINHPLARRSRLDLADLAGSRWIVYTATMPMRRLLEREFLHAGIPFPRHLVETRSAFATLSLIQNDPLFVALLSSDAANFCTGFGLTTILPIQLVSRSEPYEIVTLRNAPLPRLVSNFIEDFGVSAE